MREGNRAVVQLFSIGCASSGAAPLDILAWPGSPLEFPPSMKAGMLLELGGVGGLQVCDASLRRCALQLFRQLLSSTCGLDQTLVHLSHLSLAALLVLVAAAARAGAFGLGFFLLVGLVNAWRGSLRKISSIRRRALVASVNPCADASAKNRRASWTFWETPVPVM